MKASSLVLISHLILAFAQANEPQTFEDAYSLFYNEKTSPFTLTDTGVKLRKETVVQEVHHNEEINSKLLELKSSDLNKECGEFYFTEFGLNLKSSPNAR